MSDWVSYYKNEDGEEEEDQDEEVETIGKNRSSGMYIRLICHM